MKPEYSIDNYTVPRLDVLQQLFQVGGITAAEYAELMYAPLGQFQQELEKVLESKKP